ncbi:MAG: carbamoyltransferase [Gemmatimonadaceae bacterium]|nr:carbamoyltransferase [Gemmatimonadaceae bacterium]
MKVARAGDKYILGISAYYHDSAACLVLGEDIIAAAHEERFSRIKGDSSFPTKSAEYCLTAAGIAAHDLSAVVFYDQPLIKANRLLSTFLAIAPSGYQQFRLALPVWAKERSFLKRDIREALDYSGKLLFVRHHESHAASAFFPSPFDEAAILTIDGVGEWATSSIGFGQGSNLDMLREMRWPNSLGLLYSAFTFYTGFKVNSGEYKVMGLAPYGRPIYVDLILKHLVDLKDDGSFILDQRYFNYLGGLTMTSPAFDELFGGPPRVPESALTQKEMDLARSVQEVCEQIMLRMARTAHDITGSENLCMAGGVALNCVGNGRILREGPFKRIWIQPAAGDAGGALGAAMLVSHRELQSPRKSTLRDRMKGAYLGPSQSDDEIESYLRSIGASYEKLDRASLLSRVAGLLANEKIVGWHNGRMEFGPRSLGARSILGDPRSPQMQSQMNLKIKFREGFRPFAPSVIKERAAEYFELDVESPYMLLVAPVQQARRIAQDSNAPVRWGIDLLNVPRSDIPAVTHIDYSARVQTVDRLDNPDYYDLLKEFEKLTGCPVLVNTSFNVRGEPIVCTPADSYQCFMRTHIDHLVLGPFLLDKASQPARPDDTDWQAEFKLD